MSDWRVMPLPEPDRPAVLEGLRARFSDRAAGEDAVAAAGLAVVEWRWATPWASVEPLEVERLSGRRTRWHSSRPRSGEALKVGVDGEGRFRITRQDGMEAVTAYSYGPGWIVGWTPAAVDASATGTRWTLEDGRITEAVTIGPDRSWAWTGFTYCGGQVAVIDERSWSDQERVEIGGNKMRATVRYGPDGELDTILRERLGDGSKEFAFQAHPPQGKEQQAQLEALLRTALLNALGQLLDPASVSAVCLFTSSTDPGVPDLYVDRSGRLEDLSTVDLDDLSPPNWYPAQHDVVNLDRFAPWPRLEDDASIRRLRKAIRATVTGIAPEQLAGALGHDRPPVLFAMDTEQVDARTNLRDAFGPDIARAILRRTPNPA